MSRVNGHRLGFAAPAVAVLLFLSGCAGSPASPEGAASPSASATAPVSSAAPTAAPSASPSPSAAPSPSPSAAPAAPATPAPAPPKPAVLAASPPTSVTIPSTGTSSPLLSLGLRPNGSLEVPPDGPGAPASWYNQSPTPGERGPAVLLGHVNATDGGPGVFADLRSLKAGDTIEVTREDGSKAVFTFARGEQYAKDAFPTEKVYGNTKGSELRLITCDGYDPATGEFDDNYVVYATLVV